MAIVTEEIWTKRDFVDLARRQKQFRSTFVYKLVAAVLPASATWLIVAYFVLSFIPLVGLVLLAYVNSFA